MRIINIANEDGLAKIVHEILTQNEYKHRNRVIFLIGELGAGKTTFAKHFAKHLGIENNIVSPTFILNREYRSEESKILLNHLDLYRLDDINELIELNLNHIDQNESYTVIEWANKHIDYLKSIFKNFTIVQIRNLELSEYSREVLII